jgi:hypothetical protein
VKREGGGGGREYAEVELGGRVERMGLDVDTARKRGERERESVCVWGCGMACRSYYELDA